MTPYFKLEVHFPKPSFLTIYVKRRMCRVSNSSDLTPVPISPNWWWKVREILFFAGKSGMVKYDNLARCVYTTMCFPITSHHCCSKPVTNICFSHSFGRGILRNEDGRYHTFKVPKKEESSHICKLYKVYARENPPPCEVQNPCMLLVPVTFGVSWCYLLVNKYDWQRKIRFLHLPTVHFPAYVSFGTIFFSWWGWSQILRWSFWSLGFG